jgi:hypothetical protein
MLGSKGAETAVDGGGGQWLSKDSKETELDSIHLSHHMVCPSQCVVSTLAQDLCKYRMDAHLPGLQETVAGCS